VRTAGPHGERAGIPHRQNLAFAYGNREESLPSPGLLPLLLHPLLDPSVVDLLLYLLLTLLDLPFDTFDTLAAFIHLILCPLLQPVWTPPHGAQ